MTARRKNQPDDGLLKPGETSKLKVETRRDEKRGRTLAKVTMDPKCRNANLAMAFGSQLFDGQPPADIVESCAVLSEEIERVTAGDLSLASRVFTAQAISLDVLFTEMARRSGANMGHYPDAVDRYMRLALKAQSACRATLEALVKLHQPREQTVRHVHVNEGGQAVIAEQFHHHAGGHRNAETDRQPHAQGSCGPALLGQDAEGNGVSVPSRQGAEKVPPARRQGKRRT